MEGVEKMKGEEKMKVLVINAGSSSLKYQLINMNDESVLAKGNCERIGVGGYVKHTVGDVHYAHEADFPTHAEAFETLVKLLVEDENAVLKDMSEIYAVGHRIVQGGEKFSASTLVTEKMLRTVEKLSDLAPLHNPANVMAIRACQKVLAKSIPQVAVFDTAFHQTLPRHAYMYPIPYELYEKYKIRRYGFHGTSHRYVSGKLAEIMGRPLEDMKVITCHIGNGSSITAIDRGKSVDTSMGFTPLAGMIMGTRSGSIDPAIVTFLQEKEGLSYKGVNDLLNKESGCKGVSGLISDQRDLIGAAQHGSDRAQLALDIQRYQIKKYIGSYAAAMGGLDAVVYTGGIGENGGTTRRMSCEGLEFLGIEIDQERNKKRGGSFKISTDRSKVEVHVIVTNEELLIARDTCEVVENIKKK